MSTRSEIAERANYSCPDCGSSDLVRDRGKIFECLRCGETVHEGVLGELDSLQVLAERDDTVGTLATQLLETGGVAR